MAEPSGPDMRLQNKSGGIYEVEIAALAGERRKEVPGSIPDGCNVFGEG